MDFLLSGRRRDSDGPAAVRDRRFGRKQYLDADLTGWVVEDDRILAEIIPFGVECHGSNLSPPNDLTERNRDRPRGAVSASKGITVMGELD